MLRVYISLVHLSLIAIQVWLCQIARLEVPSFASRHFDFWGYPPGQTTQLLYHYWHFFWALPLLNAIAYMDLIRREKTPLVYAITTAFLSILSVTTIMYLLHEGLFTKVGEKLWYLPDLY